MTYEELIRIARNIDLDHTAAEAYREEGYALFRLGLQVMVNYDKNHEPEELIVRRHTGEILLRAGKEKTDGRTQDAFKENN